jgi:hypothetical protein
MLISIGLSLPWSTVPSRRGRASDTRRQKAARAAPWPRHPAPPKNTLAEMRASGFRGRLIYCSDYHCSHRTAISGDPKSPPINWVKGAIALAGVHLRGRGCTKNPTLLPRSAKRRSTRSQQFLVLAPIACRCSLATDRLRRLSLLAHSISFGTKKPRTCRGLNLMEILAEISTELRPGRRSRQSGN